MPKRPARPCSAPACPNLVTGRGRFCAEHQAMEYKAQDDRRGTSSERGYGGHWRQTRARYLARHPFCRHCGATATVAHHIVRKRDGGRDSDDNLIPLCASCHSRLHAESKESFTQNVQSYRG
jgi:5-methylcytosine-specific restriction protein A